MRQFLLSLFVLTSVALLLALNNRPSDSISDYTTATTNERDYCGSNLAWQQLLSETPGLLEEQERLETAYARDRKSAEIQRSEGPPYTIPVVFHIVHEGGTENISDAAIQTSLDFLNQSFANEGPYDPSTGVPTEIDFCLAKRTPEGTLSTGIERISHPLTNVNMSEDLDLKNLSRYDPTQYLNIWVVREICGSNGCGVAGYAYFPSAHGGGVDGIVVEARWLGNSPGGSSVLTHEIGHYLGLYHTFEGACQNDDCLIDGDRVCDTPPDQSTAAVPCNASPNSCSTDTNSGFITDQPDMFQNYMDYGDWNCYSAFTDGQRERMHFFLDGTRASLLSSQGCLDPCMLPITAMITSDFGDFVAQSEPVDFTASGSNADTYTWFVDGTEVGTGNPFSYTFTEIGSFNVSVAATNSDPNCLAIAETTASVRCPVQSSFSASSTNIGAGSVVYFTNESTNGSSFEWEVDGSTASTDMGFFYQFDNIGTYVITLIANNGNCSDDFSMIITVGLTGTAQSGLPIWPMQGGSNGGFHTLDWRPIPPLSSTVAPISEESGGTTGAAFNSCGGVVFFVAHTAEPNQPNQLFIYGADGTPLLTNSTSNAPGLNAVRAGELQVVPVPETQNEWYVIYRNFASDSGAPLNNAAYFPLPFIYSRVRLESDGSLSIVVRDEILTVGGTAYVYSDGSAVSRTVESDASRHYLYLGRRATNQSSLSLDRFIIDASGISWQSNTGTVPATYWNLTHAGSPVELSPTEDRVVVGSRNQWSNYVDYVIFPTDNFSNTAATSIITDNLVVVADGQPGDESNVLPVNLAVNQLAGNGSYPLQFLRNFPHKISRMEFSPNGRFLYMVGGGFQSGSSQLTTMSYLAQIDLETNPLQVRLQIEAPPSSYNPSTGLGCAVSQCGDQWKSLIDLESSYDGNLYFIKRNENRLYVIPNPNSFLPQKLVPGTVDIATVDEPNIDLPGGPGTLPDQIDGFNYLSAQARTVELSVFGLDCAGDCRAPFDIEVISNDESYRETFTINACPTLIPICADTFLSYRIVDLELGLEYANAIVNGEINAPAGGADFEFSEPQGCPEDCDEPFVYLYGEDADYGGRTLLADNGFLFIGGRKEDEALLTKMTPVGEVIWTQVMTPFPNLSNAIVDLKIDSEGQLIGAGTGISGPTRESFAFKLDPDNGAVIWTQTYADPNTSSFTIADIFEPSAGGGYVLLGSGQNTAGLGCDASFYNIDRNSGDIVGNGIHYHLGSCEDFQSAVVRNGNFYMTGRFNFATGGANRMRPAILATNTNGTPQWSRLYLVNVNQDARLYSSDIIQDGPNNLAILIHGDDDGADGMTNDIWILRTNLAGGAQWAVKYSFPEPVFGLELVSVTNGYLIMAQGRASNNTYIWRVNGAGDVIWAKDLANLETNVIGDEMIVDGNFIYFTSSRIGVSNNQLPLVRMDLETGDVPSACIPSTDVQVISQFITAPYGGFNSITPNETAVDGNGTFQLSPDMIEPLPISCAPACGPEDCDNGIDDDGDGLADCEDPDCDCEEEEICDNGTDDDGDGLIDCDDPDLADDCCCYVPPVLELGDDIVRCENGVVVLDAGADFESYQWSDLTTEQTITTLFSGLYSVTVTDRCGNEQADSIMIIVDLSDIDLGPDVALCPGESLTLSVDGFDTYEWFPEDGFDCSSCPTVTYTASGNDTIIVVATTPDGCISTDTLLVSIGGQQPGTFDTAELCDGDTLTFGDLTITDAGLYIDTVSIGDCVAIDSLAVSILPTFDTSEEIDICAGETILIFGTEEVSEPGVYSMDFTASNGCDSTHTVTVNVLDPVNTSEDLSVCAGESIPIFGNPESIAGEYSMTFDGSNGCDSTHTILLSVLDTFVTAETVQICEGSSVDIFGEEVSEAGDYSMTFMAENGCDSTHTVTVQVLDELTTEEDIEICPGETADIFGTPTDTPGVYSMTFEAENGCDSIHTISLSILGTVMTSEMLSICEGETADIFGNMEITAGDYSMAFMGSNGCDSTHTISLSVLDTVATSEMLGLCPGGTVTVFDETVSEAGDYSMAFAAENGCDSTHTITVFLLETFTTSETQGLCPGGSIIVFGNTVDEAGDYNMTFTAENGCDSTHTISVFLLDPIATGEDQGLCPGGSVVVFGDTVTETGDYSMTFTAENGCDSVHTVSVFLLETFATSETLADQCAEASVEIFGNTVTTSGTYSEAFTAENGCDSTHTITVTFLPPNETAEEIFLCEGESVEVFGELIDEPGVYSDAFTATNDCDSTHTITIVAEEFTGTANIFPPCPSDPESWIVYIRTVGNGGPYTVSWNGNVAVDNTINNIPVGDHVAEVTSANGCMYTVEFTIRPYNQPWWGLVAGPNCNDPKSGSIQIQTEPSDEMITFSLDGENFSPASTLEGLEEGNYVLYVKYGERCVFTDTLTVPGPEEFSLVLPDDQVIEWGESLPIIPTTNVGPGAIYKWYPNETLDCADCDKVVASPTETTRYYLEVTDDGGCTQIDDILVKVDRRIPYYVPNVFSPNGDGQNDFFTVFGDDRIEEVERMIIFDRWGGQVFTREMFPPNREQLGWNGMNRKQEVNVGVYVYYFELRLATGEVVMVKGDVMLMK